MGGILTFNAGEVKRLYLHSQASKMHSPTFDQLFDPKMHKGGVLRDKEGNQVKVDSTGFPIGNNWPDSDNVDKTNVPAGLWLVGDHGVYLMSNGTPGDMNLEPGHNEKGAHFVAYAKECDPIKMSVDGWHGVKNDVFGEDDGCEFLSLSWFKNVLDMDDDAKVRVKLTSSMVSVIFDEPKSAQKMKG